MKIIQFNFNNYFDNPIVKFCIKNNRNKLKDKIEVLDTESALEIIKDNNLKHSLWAFNNNKMSFVGDQLRLYLSTLYDDFLYLDADVYIHNFDGILRHQNCTELIQTEFGERINNGTFFHSNKDCKFNNYYKDFYQNSFLQNGIVNYQVFYKYPFENGITEDNFCGDMKLIQPDCYHFILSRFTRIPKEDTEIRYTLNPDFSAKGIRGNVWKLKNCNLYRESETRKYGTLYEFNIEYTSIGESKMLDLWKEQMEYSSGKTLKFVEV